MSGLPDRPTPLSQTEFEQSYGSAFICMVIGVFLYGISILQSYMYFMKYPGDSIFIKLLVSSLIVLGTIFTTLNCVDVYHFLVLSYTKPQLLIEGDWSLYAPGPLGTAMCFLVQAFFLHVIRQLAKRTLRIILTGVVIFLVRSLINLLMLLVITVRQFEVWFPVQMMSTPFVYSTMVPLLVLRIVPDTIISVSLCSILLDSRTGLKKTTKLINTLVVYAINRFVLTTMVVFVQLVLILVKPQNEVAIVMDVVTAQLKFNSLLATLNARSHLRRMIDRTMNDSGITNAVAQLRTGSVVQFANQPQSQSTGSLSSDTQELGDSSIVRIEKPKETYVVSDCSWDTNAPETTGNLV
ncbi:hypothetical protein K435DRAFT_843918 [Dendrothele bispora CBS 962.96]|uniref:DUF6534 domain-containing protein n=1 Tax=Dendrothele bispora (strain CBS 962.96) TaxID=1314807 RepID=A0A4S8L595_DENBC|nr:hypothetical protein K435DRAFT_843918 [Dendrothele bispora CBS 962.96]